MKIKVCVAGGTGWTGRAVVEAILKSKDFELTGLVARQDAGKELGGIRVRAGVDEALQTPADVLIDYTHPTAVKNHVLTALKKRVSVVVGTSGLTKIDYAEIEKSALEAGCGVIAAGNFSITAALAKHFSLLAAKYMPSREIVEYTSATKIDTPSGTVRELAEKLAEIAPNKLGRDIKELIGPQETRGALIEGTPVHSVRLPSYMISFETIFGLPDERLTVRHDSGAGAEPYVSGTLLAAKAVMKTKGLIRGLDTLLFHGEV